MEAFKENFIFILWTGWIIWGIGTLRKVRTDRPVRLLDVCAHSK